MFGKKKKQADNEEESIVVDQDFLDNEEADTDTVETELSIPESWSVKNEERYVYAFHNNQSPKLKRNQVSIYGIELNKLKNNGYVATALIKNTVQKEIQFNETTILLLGPDNEVVARKEFDLSRVGKIPANGARPWKFNFTPQDIVTKTDLPKSEWKLAFELKKKHQLDLDESWEKSIAEETKANLEKIVANAAPLKPGEVNFMGISAKYNDNNDLAVTILIRNGSRKNMTLEQIPLAFKDASEEIVAKGAFKLEDFVIKANTSKPWTFIFPASLIKKEDIDLSKWQVYPIQN
ncbi:accessory Sec system S-layer assembly protein [Lentibacillus sp. Marseille-P4043]|uniref:accessory Sec system S-layer assembly protein n=1 Tax=Lentibacillus sp. Marseille-P4043 TaxID=2040293 RepID=UPI000D0B95D3|nr:accessory Sec system S-layer assembly protein [Lentibacillus sp. Marseille-P4043]